jgi:hypothetical protein
MGLTVVVWPGNYEQEVKEVREDIMCRVVQRAIVWSVWNMKYCN